MIDLMHIFNVSFRLAFFIFNIYNDLTDANLDLNMHGDLFAFRPSATRTGIARAEPSRAGRYSSFLRLRESRNHVAPSRSPTRRLTVGYDVDRSSPPRVRPKLTLGS